MTHNLNTPMAYAIVTVAGRPSLDFDPVLLQVEAGAFADPYDPSFIAILDGIEQYLADKDQDATVDGLSPDHQVNLVWQDTRETVEFMCPMCDEAMSAVVGTSAAAHENGESDSICCWDCLEG